MNKKLLTEIINQRKLELVQKTRLLVEYHKTTSRDYVEAGLGISSANLLNWKLRSRPKLVTIESCWIIEEILKDKKQKRKSKK